MESSKVEVKEKANKAQELVENEGYTILRACQEVGISFRTYKRHYVRDNGMDVGIVDPLARSWLSKSILAGSN